MQAWPLVLSNWHAAGTRIRAHRYRGKLGNIEYADEEIERIFELPEGQVSMCLHVVDGRPSRYGVSVVN